MPLNATLTGITQTVPPPQPGGDRLFDGRAALMTVLYSYEDTPDDRNTLHQDQTPDIWTALTFQYTNLGRGIRLTADSRYGQVYTVITKIGDASPWQPAGSFLAAQKGAGQVSIRRSNNLGLVDYLAIAVRVDSFPIAVTSLNWYDFTSFGYQTSSGDQVTLRLKNTNGVLQYAISQNAGFANNPSGYAHGTNEYYTGFKDVTFGQWEEFVYAVKWATDNTGYVQIYNRAPTVSSTWTKVFEKLNCPTYLYGVTSYGTFAQDGSNWLTVLDKIGCYWGIYSTATPTSTVYESGLVRTADLASAQASFPP